MYEVNFIYKPLLFIIDIIGYALFWWIKFKSFKEPKKILCIRAENIGDVVLATPTFRALKQKFPDAEVDVLVRSLNKNTLEGNKNVDGIVVFDLPWLGLQGKKSSWWQTLSFIRRLRKEKYDLVIDFHGDPRNILLAFLIGKYRIGFGIRGFGFLLDKIASFNGKQHQIQINLDLVRVLGADSNDALDFIISKKDMDHANGLLQDMNKKNFIVISPSAGRKDKLWISENWSRLCNILIDKYDHHIVFTGGINDLNLINEIIKKANNKDRVVNLAGKTSITQLGAVIKNSKLLICPDSGPAHIARALNTTLIVLFSKEDPKRWGYDEKNFKYVRKDNMKNISVEDVLKVIKDMSVLR